MEYEKNISAEQYFTQKDPWLSCPYVDKKRPSCYKEETCKGAQTTVRFNSFKIVGMKEYGFPKGERLLKRSDFQRLSRQSRKVHTEHFIIICGGTDGESRRIGITVSRKVGNAVTRNRTKRMIREFYRLNKKLFLLSDYNFIAKAGVVCLIYSELVRELTVGLKLLGKKQCLSN